MWFITTFCRLQIESRVLVQCIGSQSIHDGASHVLVDLGRVDLDMGSSPCWWAATLATYCPSKVVEHPSKSTKPSLRGHGTPCTVTELQHYVANQMGHPVQNTFDFPTKIMLDHPVVGGDDVLQRVGLGRGGRERGARRRRPRRRREVRPEDYGGAQEGLVGLVGLVGRQGSPRAVRDRVGRVERQCPPGVCTGR